MPEAGIRRVPPRPIPPERLPGSSAKGRLLPIPAPFPVIPLIESSLKDGLVEDDEAADRGRNESSPPLMLGVVIADADPPAAGTTMFPPMADGSTTLKPPPIDDPDIAPYPPRMPPRPGSWAFAEEPARARASPIRNMAIKVTRRRVRIVVPLNEPENALPTVPPRESIRPQGGGRNGPECRQRRSEGEYRSARRRERR